MAQKTAQINEAIVEEKASNSSFWKFAKNEASRFYLDENRNLNVIIYKQVKFTIEGANDCESESFVNNVREIKRNIIKLIKMFHILDADLIMPEDGNEFEFINSGKVLMMTYLFPAIDGVNKVLESFYSFCRNLQYDFKVVVKVSDICKITYDNRTLDETDAFIRGYVAGSYFPAIEGKHGTKLQKTYLRSDCGIAKSTGFDITDLKKFNTYNSAFNRVRLFRGGENGKEVSTLIPFRGKISIVAYKANGCVSNGILNFIRSVYDISYTYVRDKDKKSITAYGPRGIRVTSYTDEVETGNFIDLFYKDDVNLVTTAFLGANESEYPEWSVFMNEANQFSKCFLDSFEPSKDDEPAADVEAESSEAAEKAVDVAGDFDGDTLSVVKVEDPVEEPAAEKPKKTSKKKTSKKAKTEEVTEEVPVTEEPVTEAE
jgi:hypothetical protein